MGRGSEAVDRMLNGMMTLLHAILIIFCVQAPQSATIRGKLVDVSDGALSGASVRVLESESHTVVARVIANQSGVFEVGPLKPGAYKLTARLRGFRLRIVTGLILQESTVRDLGTLRVDLAGCDAPGTVCDTFSAEPAIPN